MSELKAIESATAVIEKVCLVYRKSEADKVIAEKDTEIAELKKQVHDYGQGLYVMQARAEKEARHDKYKRCLAMAKWCEAELFTYPPFGTESPKEKWWNKWYRRWLELAKKFKEAK